MKAVEKTGERRNERKKEKRKGSKKRMTKEEKNRIVGQNRKIIRRKILDVRNKLWNKEQKKKKKRIAEKET